MECRLAARAGKADGGRLAVQFTERHFVQAIFEINHQRFRHLCKIALHGENEHEFAKVGKKVRS